MSSLVLTTQTYAPSGVHPNRQRDAHPPPTLQEGTYIGHTCLTPPPTCGFGATNMAGSGCATTQYQHQNELAGGV